MHGNPALPMLRSSLCAGASSHCALLFAVRAQLMLHARACNATPALLVTVANGTNGSVVINATLGGATGAEDVPWAKDVAKGQVVLKSFVQTGSAVVHERLRSLLLGAQVLPDPAKDAPAQPSTRRRRGTVVGRRRRHRSW